MPVYALRPDSCAFPNPAEAEEDGLLAVGGDLSPKRLLTAYASGIFPWYGKGCPILWWSPDPRCILKMSALHVPRSLEKILRKGTFRFTLDKAFAEVIRSCADRENTWLVPEMIDAYISLHKSGLAHSLEAWQDGELAGGIYGVALGRAFFGESMFYRRPNASKASLVTLVRHLRKQGFLFMDCQQVTDNSLRFGAKPVPRPVFLNLLQQALDSRLPVEKAWIL